MVEWSCLVRPVVMSFLSGVLLFPLFIWWQKLWGVGQKIKKEGPNLHLHKENTPTMGGVIIVVAILIGLLMGGGFVG
ncbi:MAG: phospho-N-acetylmuramoyl-pentapeptide-transferase, partial [Atribacterota bacterium]|nr:phospho-N-acetylmuramoyl-pentapeptide-transferase [Atribacterota bacterium]